MRLATCRPSDGEAAGQQFASDPPDAVEGQLGMHFVDRRHELQVALAGGHRLVVDARAREAEQARLTGDR